MSGLSKCYNNKYYKLIANEIQVSELVVPRLTQLLADVNANSLYRAEVLARIGIKNP